MYVIADRVKQKCSVIGTGPVTLGATINGFKPFSDVASNTDVFHYMLVNIQTGEWETGLGTYNAGTIARTTVLASPSSNAPVNFSPGEKEIMIALLAGNTVIQDNAGLLQVNGVAVTADSISDGGINKFYTDAKARLAISAGDTNISYNNVTGEISLGNNIQIGGNLTVTGDTVLDGDLTVNGTTTTVNSEVTTLENPIIALGGQGPLSIDDGKDRGVQFRYYDGEEKIGFFGWQHDTGKFIYIPDATETAGEYSGVLGPMDFRVSQPALVLQRITTNHTLAPGEGISVDTTTGTVDITLPASPTLNDSVIVADGGGDKIFKPAFIRRNGSTINGVADDLEFNVPLKRLSFVFDSTTWRMTHA